MNQKGIREIIEEAERAGKIRILSDVPVGNFDAPAPADNDGEVAPKKPRKYRNQPTEVDGVLFDSKKEADRWVELKMLERAGLIRDLERQVPFELKVGEALIGKLILDHTYVGAGDKKIYEDVKSAPTVTRLFRWKKKHAEAQYGIEITLYM